MKALDLLTLRSDMAKALGKTLPDGTPLVLDWKQILDAIWELRAELNNSEFWSIEAAEALEKVHQDGSGVELDWGQIVDAIHELREERNRLQQVINDLNWQLKGHR